MERKGICCTALLGLAIAAFGLFLSAPFLSDDIPIIRENFWLTWHHIPNFYRSFLFEPSLGFQGYRPLPLTIFTVLKEVFGATPFVFRLLSISIHLLNTFLFFRLLEEFLPKSPKINLCVFAGLFLLHPLQSFLIGLAWNLPDLLFFTGTLMSVLCFKQERYLVGLFGVLLSILSKENALFLPPFLFALHLFGRKSGEQRRISGFAVTGLGLLFTAHVLILYVVQERVISKFGTRVANIQPPSTTFQIFDYWLEQIALIPEYVQLLFLPTNLSFFRQADVNTLTIVLGLMILLLCLSLIFLGLKKRTLWGGSLAFGFFFALPGMVFPLNLAFDADRMLLPLVGLIGFLAGIWNPSWKARRFLYALLVVFTLFNIHQAHIWRSAGSLWRHNVMLEPEDARAWLALGLSREGNAAKNAIAKAAILEPGFTKAHLELGKIFLREGKWSKARSAILRAKDQPGLRADALMHLGILEARLEHYKRAEEYFLRSIETNPYFLPTYQNLAVLYQRLSRMDDALEILQRSLAYGSSAKTLKMIAILKNQKAD